MQSPNEDLASFNSSRIFRIVCRIIDERDKSDLQSNTILKKCRDDDLAVMGYFRLFFMSTFDINPADLATSTPMRIATAIMTIVPEGATL